jgi:magnesium chelatase subunit I
VITRQEAWTERGAPVKIPTFVAEIIEEVAFQAREDSRVDKHSGVSQRLPISLMENVVSNAERRALLLGEQCPITRTVDLYAGLSAVTGKLELEYEGELKGGEAVARDIVRRAIGQSFTRRSVDLHVSEIIDYFEADHSLKVPEKLKTDQLPDLFVQVPGLLEAAGHLAEGQHPTDLAVAAEFILEGLCARKQVARSEERGYTAIESDMAQTPHRRWN